MNAAPCDLTGAPIAKWGEQLFVGENEIWSEPGMISGRGLWQHMVLPVFGPPVFSLVFFQHIGSFRATQLWSHASVTFSLLHERLPVERYLFWNPAGVWLEVQVDSCFLDPVGASGSNVEWHGCQGSVVSKKVDALHLDR